MKIVRDFRYEVAQVDSKVPPPPENSKIADLDSVLKVRFPKYPPPKKNSKIADLDIKTILRRRLYSRLGTI